MRFPLFNGTNCSYWRIRMKLFIQANDYEVLRIVTNGPSIPRKMVECPFVPKEEDEWDENDIKKKKRGSSKQKLKAYIATWSDEDSSDNEDQEVANIFLMAIDDI
ncbi:hypothetical protein PVK06_039917 [Gossypium arboreum]|uniref:DUF4219 domain-containing protein n=1 Tax=Gossypium arboreum TaxID=29729 RepID=A0ABR0N439_GOSAR|nr:hypothetical protein PVK06_039917 [Gossypium arboreum]